MCVCASIDLVESSVAAQGYGGRNEDESRVRSTIFRTTPNPNPDSGRPRRKGARA